MIMILIVVIVVIVVSVIVIYYMKKQKRRPPEYDYMENYSLPSNLNARDHIVATNNPAYVSEPTQPSDYNLSPVRKSPSSEPTPASDLSPFMQSDI